MRSGRINSIKKGQGRARKGGSRLGTFFSLYAGLLVLLGTLAGRFPTREIKVAWGGFVEAPIVARTQVMALF